MKAAIYTSYGPPNVVQITDVEKPVPKDNEVLIKVRAASVNPLDWRLMKGEPRAMRIMARLLKMPIGRPGVDMAGEIEAVQTGRRSVWRGPWGLRRVCKHT